MVLTFRVVVSASQGKIQTVNIHLLPEMVLVPSAFQSLPEGSLFPAVLNTVCVYSCYWGGLEVRISEEENSGDIKMLPRQWSSI